VQTQTDLGPGHINLINVYELFLTPDCLGLVMECGHGGSLTSYVGGKWKDVAQNGLILQEDEALYLFKQFISAVSYCHRHDLAHRCGPHWVGIHGERRTLKGLIFSIGSGGVLFKWW